MAGQNFVDLTTDEPKMPKTQRIAIDPEGNIYLQLENLELRVSSKVLATASKVFNAMFKSDFQEGLHLTKGEDCRIPLPDDPVTMHLLCLITHSRETPASLAKIESQYLRKVALLAAKYECIAAVRYWADSCMERINNFVKFDENHMVDSLLAAYVMNQYNRFTDITKRMVHCDPRDDSELSQRGWRLDQEARDVLPRALIHE